MTYEQLLRQIEWLGQTSSYIALKAVVDLHRPMNDREPYCNECRGVHQGEVDVVLYPCPTIQAIKKELE